jgi:hypothetical protein
MRYPTIDASRLKVWNLPKYRGSQALANSSRSTFFWESGSEWCYHRHETQITVRARKSRYGFMGPILYDEKNMYLAAKTEMTLATCFLNKKFGTYIRA